MFPIDGLLKLNANRKFVRVYACVRPCECVKCVRVRVCVAVSCIKCILFVPIVLDNNLQIGKKRSSIYVQYSMPFSFIFFFFLNIVKQQNYELAETYSSIFIWGESQHFILIFFFF